MRAAWCIFVSGAVLAVACSSKSGGACEGDGLPLQCDCKAGESPRQPVSECSAATVGTPVLCCQSQSDCFCTPSGCAQVSSEGFCTCGAGAGGSLAECTGPAPCCATPGPPTTESYCICGYPCLASDTPVASCTQADLRCPTGQTRVDKCVPQ